MRQVFFRQVMAAVDAVHDLQGAVVVRLRAARLDPLHELARFLRVPKAYETIQREGSVADPGVAIIPVALAAHLLGQAKRRRRHYRAVHAGGEEFQR